MLLANSVIWWIFGSFYGSSSMKKKNEVLSTFIAIYIVHRYLHTIQRDELSLFAKKVHMLVWKYFYRLSFPSLFSSSSFLVWRMDNLFLKSIFMLIEQFSDFQFQSTMFGNHINYVGLSLASTYTTKMFFTYLLHLYREWHDF